MVAFTGAGSSSPGLTCCSLQVRTCNHLSSLLLPSLSPENDHFPACGHELGVSGETSQHLLSLSDSRR